MAPVSQFPLNPELRRQAEEAIFGDDDDSPDTPVAAATPTEIVAKLDENSSSGKMESEETPAEQNSDHAGEEASATQAETPSAPETPTVGPPEQRLYAGRFKELETFEESYKETQADRTRLAQRLAEKEAELQSLQQRLYRETPIEELTEAELAQLEQEAKRDGFGSDILEYRRQRTFYENRERKQHEAVLEQNLKAFVRTIPNYERDLAIVQERVTKDPSLVEVPDYLPPQEKEARYQAQFQRLFREVDLEHRAATTAATKRVGDEAKQAQADKQKELVAAATADNPSKSKAAPPPATKPAAPGNFGDELLRDSRELKPWWQRKEFRD